MFSFIARVRRKPEGVRRNIAFFAAAALTGAIFLFWLFSFALRQEPQRVAAPRREEPGPLRSFASVIGAMVGDTAVKFREFQQEFSFPRTVYPVSAPASATSVRAAIEPR